MNAHIALTVPHAWHHIRLTRKRVTDALVDADSVLRSAGAMTASELLENAIKYGEDVPAAPNISFSMVAEGGRLQFEVSNGATQTSGVRELQQRIDEVSRAPDKATLYMRRLEQLLANPTESGKLGIYRIAFEGKFDLECRYFDQVVTVIATRVVQ
jgi:hypothetical protein